MDRLAGLVPTEAVTLYAVATGLFPDTATAARVGGAAGLFVTVASMVWYGRRVRLVPSVAQHGIRALAFVAWSFLLANPLAPAAPVAHWLPTLAVLLVPVIGLFVFPPSRIGRA